MLEHILNWKLLTGSHEFPGPDGGTCINEAAMVVAGFPYRQINSVKDCPPCFSRPIAAYALGLNDKMPDEWRQKLLPFVTKLAGTADTPEIELERLTYIWVQTSKLILAPLFSQIGLPKEAEALAKVTTCQEVAARAARAAEAARAARAAWAAEAAEAARAARAAWAAEAARAAWAAWAAEAAEAARAAWPTTLEILTGVLAIGKQAEPIEHAVILKRAEAAKTLVRMAQQ